MMSVISYIFALRIQLMRFRAIIFNLTWSYGGLAFWWSGLWSRDRVASVYASVLGQGLPSLKFGVVFIFYVPVFFLYHSVGNTRFTKSPISNYDHFEWKIRSPAVTTSVITLPVNVRLPMDEYITFILFILCVHSNHKQLFPWINYT